MVQFSSTVLRHCLGSECLNHLNLTFITSSHPAPTLRMRSDHQSALSPMRPEPEEGGTAESDRGGVIRALSNNYPDTRSSFTDKTLQEFAQTTSVLSKPTDLQRTRAVIGNLVRCKIKPKLSFINTVAHFSVCTL